MTPTPRGNRWKVFALVGAAATFAAAGSACYFIAFVLSMTDSFRVLCLMMAPPWFLLSIVLLGRLALEFGWSDVAPNELDWLLERKRCGALKHGARSFWKQIRPAKKVEAPVVIVPVPPELSHHVQAAAPIAKTFAPSECDQPLERLISWKRQNIRTGERDDE